MKITYDVPIPEPRASVVTPAPKRAWKKLLTEFQGSDHTVMCLDFSDNNLARMTYASLYNLRKYHPHLTYTPMLRGSQVYLVKKGDA